LGAATLAIGQDPAPTPATGGSEGNNNAGGNNRRREFNPEQFREAMAQRLKTELKVSDEEWKVLQPLIENVTNKQRDAMVGSFGGNFGRNRSRNGGGGNNSSTQGSSQNNGTGQTANNSSNRGRAPSPEMEALKQVLDTEGASNEDLKAKLSAVRDIREKNFDALKSAREDLRKVLTLRQEAALVMMGILD